MNEETLHTVGEEDVGKRLDKWLAECLPALSRTQVKQLIDEGGITAQHGPCTPSHIIAVNETYAVLIPELKPSAILPTNIPIDVVWEDAHLMVLNKPAGLSTHPSPGDMENTLVNALLWHRADQLSGIGGVVRPGIVHLLDKDTSGLMVVAKHDVAHRRLAEQLSDHTLHRKYDAFTFGVPKPPSGIITGDIGRNKADRKKMAVVTRNGKPATTHYQLQESLANGYAALVGCRLETGRTHQIRVHLSYKGYALIGDPLYGHKSKKSLRGLDEKLIEVMWNFPRQALHAAEIGFIHPDTGAEMRFERPWPEDMRQLYARLGT